MLFHFYSRKEKKELLDNNINRALPPIGHKTIA